MMIFKYKGIDTDFVIDGSTSYNLIIENPKYLYKFLSDLVVLNEESLFLSENYKIININKKIILIDGLYNLEINSKKILGSFYKMVEEKYFKTEYVQWLNEINILINKMFFELNLDLDISIDYKDTIFFKDLCTIVELKILDESKTNLEKLILYIKLLNSINDIKIVFIPFLNSFLEEYEIKLLKEELSLLEINIFNITSFDKNIVDFEKIIIDYDLCEI